MLAKFFNSNANDPSVLYLLCIYSQALIMRQQVVQLQKIHFDQNNKKLCVLLALSIQCSGFNELALNPAIKMHTARFLYDKDAPMKNEQHVLGQIKTKTINFFVLDIFLVSRTSHGKEYSYSISSDFLHLAQMVHKQQMIQLIPQISPRLVKFIRSTLCSFQHMQCHLLKKRSQLASLNYPELFDSLLNDQMEQMYPYLQKQQSQFLQAVGPFLVVHQNAQLLRKLLIFSLLPCNSIFYLAKVQKERPCIYYLQTLSGQHGKWKQSHRFFYQVEKGNVRNEQQEKYNSKECQPK